MNCKVFGKHAESDLCYCSQVRALSHYVRIITALAKLLVTSLCSQTRLADIRFACVMHEQKGLSDRQPSKKKGICKISVFKPDSDIDL
jgi:hypothetical protein